jgi:hypothetical protein
MEALQVPVAAKRTHHHVIPINYRLRPTAWTAAAAATRRRGKFSKKFTKKYFLG